VGCNVIGRRRKKKEEEEVSSLPDSALLPFLPNMELKENKRGGRGGKLLEGEVLGVEVVVEVVSSEPVCVSIRGQRSARPSSSHSSPSTSLPSASFESIVVDRTHAPEAARTEFPTRAAEGADRGVEEKAWREEGNKEREGMREM